MNIEFVYRLARKYGYDCRDFGSSPNVIIIGESRFDKTGLSWQKELIERLDPEFVLSDRMFTSVYDPLTPTVRIPHRGNTTLEARVEESAGISASGDIKYINHLIEWSDRYGFTLVGAKITMNDCTNNPYLYADIFEGSQRRGIAYKIGEYALKTKMPLVVITSSRNLATADEYIVTRKGKVIFNPKSEIHELLGLLGIDYICVDQTGRNCLSSEYIPGKFTKDGMPLLERDTIDTLLGEIQRRDLSMMEIIHQMYQDNPNMKSLVAGIARQRGISNPFYIEVIAAPILAAFKKQTQSNRLIAKVIGNTQRADKDARR